MRKILLVILFIGLVPTAGQGAAPRSPQIDITPASPFAFPNTVPGAMSRQIFKVTNLTRASIQTQVLIRANGNFTYNWRVANSCGMPGLSSRFLRRVGPGQSCNVEIIFSPKLAGVHSHSVQIRALDLRRRIINTTVLSLQGPSRPPLLPASQVTQVNPPVAASGQDVFFEGKGLEQIREVKFGDTSAVFNFDRANGIFSVTVPVGLSRGEHSVVVNGVIQVPKLRLEPFCSSDGLIVENKSLFITDPSVINHPRATFSGGSGSEWSFAHLMGKMAGVEDSDEQFNQKTSEFIKDWFDTFSNPGTELRIEGRDIWRLMPSKEMAVNDFLAGLPMKLSAIIYRPDLAEEGQTAGEGRFIYEVHNSSFTVILEYGLPINEANSRADWARRWAELSSLTLGSEEYRDKLLEVTRAFTDQRFSGRPNESAINQVRTNEIMLSFPWELREWTLPSRGDGVLVSLLPDTVKQTPRRDLSTEQKEELRQWWESESCSNPSVGNREGCSTVMPERFLAGAAHTDGVSFGMGTAFDMMTCNGCHSSSVTSPLGFVHVARSRIGVSSSRFLQNDLIARKSVMVRELEENFCK